jgi:hypothetical protein
MKRMPKDFHMGSNSMCAKLAHTVRVARDMSFVTVRWRLHESRCRPIAAGMSELRLVRFRPVVPEGIEWAWGYAALYANFDSPTIEPSIAKRWTGKNTRGAMKKDG